MVKVKFSSVVIGELEHKLSILCDEPDLQESYGVDQQRADQLYTRFYRAKPGFFELNEKEAEIIQGELENIIDICTLDVTMLRPIRYVISQIAKGGFENIKRKPRSNVIKITRPRGKKGRVYPINGVVEAECARVEQTARELIAAYESRAREQGRQVVKIKDRPLKFYATDKRAGWSWAHYNRKGVRIVEVSIDTIRREAQKPGYFTYVVAHELAHHYAQFKHKTHGHGEMFMYWLKQLCPSEYVHYELEYKPKFARAAGIRTPEQKVA